MSLEICIAANFTAEPIEPFLAFWMRELAIEVNLRFAPYNQVFQQLMDGGLLRANTGGINLIGLDLEAWLSKAPELSKTRELSQAPWQELTDAAPDHLHRIVGDLLAALRAAASSGAGGAVLLFPASASQPDDRKLTVASARDLVLTECASIHGWHAIDLAAACALYSVAEIRDPFTDELGHIPFTEEMYAAAATTAARWVYAGLRKQRKVIALDCDHTLWQGVCGEGPLVVTPPYQKLQEFMRKQQESGMLLVLTSRNNEQEVLAALDSQNGGLRSEHLTSWRINWQSKSENLVDLANELGLELKSFVFLDDSSFECLEVRNRTPEVLAIQLPTDPEEIPSFLNHLWVFDRAVASDEDRIRARSYQSERQRSELRRTLTPDEFFASLKLEIEITPAAPTELARVAQLTQRTTQFNLTGVVHTEQTIAYLLAQGRHECWTVRVRDVFGDYGLVGVILFETDRESLRVSEFLLSCRALGRRVEDSMLEKLRACAASHEAERIVLPLTPTERNVPVREFLHRLCGAPLDVREPFDCILSVAGDSAAWKSPEKVAEKLAEVSVAQPQAFARPASTRPLASDEAGVLIRIANRFRAAAALVSAVESSKKQREPALQYVLPRNGVEQKLTTIWSDCLRVEPIGVSDDFSELGGTSLAAARILARVRREFGTKLSLAEFYRAPTVEGVASKLKQGLPDCLDADRSNLAVAGAG